MMMKMMMLTLASMTSQPVMRMMTNLQVKGQGHQVQVPAPQAVEVRDRQVLGQGQDPMTENDPSILGLGPGNW